MLTKGMTMNLADDLLNGAKEIADYINQGQRRTYHLLETGQLPASILGGRWTSRKSTIMVQILKLETGDGAGAATPAEAPRDPAAIDAMGGGPCGP